MQTEQELEEENKAIAKQKQLEADKPLIDRASDAWWDWRERNGLAFILSLVGVAILGVIGIVAHACNMK